MAIWQSPVEGVEMNSLFWRGKRVLITGHTGFKGSWLTLCLYHMGAEIHGFALTPPTEPSLFNETRIEELMASSTIDNICNKNNLCNIVQSVKPEVVFHLAAQSLVRRSYYDPVETYYTNVMGTVNLLESVRLTHGIRAVVNVTSDKCYENQEWVWGYRENEPLGGRDPYSSSKACAEMVTSAYRKSFLDKAGVALATVRAGNVIGGGDWAADRLIPDFLRAFDRGEILQIRSPDAKRPWQHVLEPLYGYIKLAELLYTEGKLYSEAWNFGPSDEDVKPVRWIVEKMASFLPGVTWKINNACQPYEAHCLKLNSSKAENRLGWRPQWRLETALAKALEWHTAWRSGSDMRVFTLSQLSEYQERVEVDKNISV